MASLMFRARGDNKCYSGAKKSKGSGVWYVFSYDLRGKKVRARIGPNKRMAELARGEIEARLAKQRGGLLDPFEDRMVHHNRLGHVPAGRGRQLQHLN